MDDKKLMKIIGRAARAIGGAMYVYTLPCQRYNETQALKAWFLGKLARDLKPTGLDSRLLSPVESFFYNVRDHDREVVNDPDELNDVWEFMEQTEIMSEMISEHMQNEHSRMVRMMDERNSTKKGSHQKSKESGRKPPIGKKSKPSAKNSSTNKPSAKDAKRKAAHGVLI